MSKTKYQVLARKYRPRTFSEVVGQEAIVTTLKNALKFDKVAHAYLFCGSRGVGKTTLARLFAQALNCQARRADFEPCNECGSCVEIGTGQSLDVIEIDGASNRGIDDVRQINETLAYAPSQGRFKIYIIDEVHMLTKEAFNALLKTLEEPPEKVKFFFATTEPHKVLPTIISRCQRFDLGRIASSQIIAKLEQIALDLGRAAEPGALHLIASFSDGSLRDAESLFDQILCFAEGTITADEMRKALGLISQDSFFSLDQAFSECRTSYAFELVESLFSAGKDLTHCYTQLIEHIRWLALAKTVGEKGMQLPEDMKIKYLESARLYTAGQCLYLLDYLLKAESQIQRSACQRVSFEALLLHYIQSKHRLPVEVLIRKLSELEEKIKNQKPESLAPAAVEVKTQSQEPSDPVAIPPIKEAKTPAVSASRQEERKIEQPKMAPHHPSHYDTLIRFAAVELEGTVKK
jgi:DNA polymerase-3 subunit gamma/tau